MIRRLVLLALLAVGCGERPVWHTYGMAVYDRTSRPITQQGIACAIALAVRHVSMHAPVLVNGLRLEFALKGAELFLTDYLDSGWNGMQAGSSLYVKVGAGYGENALVHELLHLWLWDLLRVMDRAHTQEPRWWSLDAPIKASIRSNCVEQL